MKEVDLQRTMDSIFHVCKFGTGQTMFQQKSMEMIVREIILFASKVNHLEQIQLIGKQR